MGGGMIGKFVYFWMFLLGGLIVAKLLGVADTASNMIVLSIALALVFVVWNVLRAKSQENAAAKKAASRPKTGSQSKKKKKKR
ncbi:hypothetical protein LI177_08705 [bacterium 210820-DFI.6.37]|nr:hypothetical protein [bacterium 210820-DFI.6.37]